MESASSKCCNTAIFALVNIICSSVKFAQKYSLIVLSSTTKAYFDHILFVLKSFKYHALANLTRVVIVPSSSISVLVLFSFPKNL
jgi:hypothetical protein